MKVHSDLPARCVALQVLALPLQHACSDLSSSWVMLAGVLDVFQLAQRHIWIDEVRVALDKLGPLKISRHADWAAAESFHGRVHLVCVALQNAGESIVRFLNFADHNRL